MGDAEANANIDTINRYKNFFLPTREALRVYFFIELAKLFDDSDQSLHIAKVVNFTESNIKRLNVEAFREYNSAQSREFLVELVKGYEGVSSVDIKDIRDNLNAHKESLDKLTTYRDQWLAHSDLHKIESLDITGVELRELFDLLAKILNSLTGKLNRASTMWDHVEGNTKHDTKLVIDHLRRFEPYRLKEIEAEHEERLKQLK